MLMSKFNLVSQSILTILAAIYFTLVMQTMAGAAERTPVQAGRHKAAVKKSHQRVATAVQFKKATPHPRKTAAKTGTGRKTVSKSPPSSLKLSRDIESTLQEPSQIASAKPKQINQISPKPPQDLSGPPLQIGKTLYQRNGEIRQLESQ